MLCDRPSDGDAVFGTGYVSHLDMYVAVFKTTAWGLRLNKSFSARQSARSSTHLLERPAFGTRGSDSVHAESAKTRQRSLSPSRCGGVF